MRNCFKPSFLLLVLWNICFIIVPVLILSFFAITDQNNNFTLSNLLKIGSFWRIILRSALFATITTVICLIIAYPFAYFVFKTVKPSNQKLIIALVTLPMWTNLLLRTFAWMTLIEKNGLINKILMFLNLPTIKLINTPAAVILVMIYDFLPFMIIPIFSSINKISNNIMQASNDLGAGELQTLKRVIFPLSIKGVFYGIGTTFVLSCSSFIIPRMMSGGTTILIGDLIESQFLGSSYNPWLGSALALGLNAAIILMFLLILKLRKPKKGNLSNETAIFQ